MHINDIQAFAKRVAADQAFGGKVVVIRAPAEKGGKYLGRRGQFDADKENAARYHYDEDKVSQQYFRCLMNEMPIEIELAPQDEE